MICELYAECHVSVSMDRRVGWYERGVLRVAFSLPEATLLLSLAHVIATPESHLSVRLLRLHSGGVGGMRACVVGGCTGGGAGKGACGVRDGQLRASVFLLPSLLLTLISIAIGSWQGA